MMVHPVGGARKLQINSKCFILSMYIKVVFTVGTFGLNPTRLWLLTPVHFRSSLSHYKCALRTQRDSSHFYVFCYYYCTQWGISPLLCPTTFLSLMVYVLWNQIMSLANKHGQVALLPEQVAFTFTEIVNISSILNSHHASRSYWQLFIFFMQTVIRFVLNCQCKSPQVPFNFII